MTRAPACLAVGLLLFGASAAAQPVKNVYVWDPGGDPAQLDQWYRQFHGPETIGHWKRWMRHYWTFRAIEAPPEADRFGVSRYRLTEIAFDSIAARDEAVPHYGTITLHPGLRLASPVARRPTPRSPCGSSPRRSSSIAWLGRPKDVVPASAG